MKKLEIEQIFKFLIYLTMNNKFSSLSYIENSVNKYYYDNTVLPIPPETFLVVCK